MAEKAIDKKNIKSTVDGNFILYRNRPLVREDNVICYGNVADKCVLKMIIMTEKEYKGKNVPDQIYLQLLSTDESVPANKRVLKEGMKSGLGNALDTGIAWLERYTA